MAENIFLQVNKAKDPNNLTGPEEKHIPALTIKGAAKAGEPFQLEVQVGRALHPMDNEHHIQFVELFWNDLYLTRVPFTPVIQLPKASLSLVLTRSGKLRAQGRCNLHGVWEGEVELKF